MNDNYSIVGGVFNPDPAISIEFAKEIDIPTNRIYATVEELVAKENALPAEERMQVISVLTPNFLHFPMAKALLEGGFNVICEKPMTTTYEEAKILADLQQKSGAVFALTHTYTGYPMVRQMREMIRAGAIGAVHKVDAQYYQGWINPLIHDEKSRKATWRLDPAKSGISCCIGDIGVHAFNLLEYTCGLEVRELLSDFNFLYDDNVMDVDGTVLVRMDKHVKGVIRASQIATAEENNISISVYGRKGGLKWEQENPNYLYLLEEGKPLQVLKPGHAYNSAMAKDATKLPPGHPEGIFDAMANIYLGVAKAIRGEKIHEGEYPTVRDGVRGMNFIEATVESNQKGNVWVTLNND
jgi:predicted dehydrogenase